MNQLTYASFNTKVQHRNQIEDDGFDAFLRTVQANFNEIVRAGGAAPALFTTNVSGEALWAAYLSNAPTFSRQSRNCNCCRSFIQHFGNLVTIDAEGRTESAIWPDWAPSPYARAVKAMKGLVETARVTGVYKTKDATWGTPITGPWTHFALTVPTLLRSTSRVLTPFQEAAEKTQDFEMLKRALGEFSLNTARQAVAITAGDALYRSEKVEGVAKWFKALLENASTIQGKRNAGYRDAIIWRAVAAAPPGYCHIRSTMIGTLLEDLQAGLPFEDVKRKFGAKMNPLQYMRPTAPPTAGNIAQAEKLFTELKATGALERRFARLEDVEKLWIPRPAKSAPRGLEPVYTIHGGLSGTFGHLAPKAPKTKPPVTSTAPAQTMTWAKFRDTILPHAEEIEFLVPNGAAAYTAMVTAMNRYAPNLLQWDNPVSHYVYVNGSEPRKWNLSGGTFTKVNAVVLRSWMWGAHDNHTHHGKGVVFTLAGCRDVDYVASGGMFPEQMKSEYHPVRRTLEAHFSTAVIQGKYQDEQACGIALVAGTGGGWGHTFRALSNGIRQTYKLDRWD